MKRYFINPELKASSTVIIVFFIIFSLCTSFIININNKNLKTTYINSLGIIVDRIAQKNPEYINEVLPLITKEATPEEAKRGSFILSQYGLGQNLENELFPYVKGISSNINLSFMLLFLIAAVMLFMINYYQYAFFYKRIRKLTTAAKKVVEGDFDLQINEDKEGDFSKLATSFNSMRQIIRNNMEALKKEKQFLVDLLSDMSHQLKTPLASMILYNDILLDKELDKQQQKLFLQRNQNQLYRMNSLIQTILKLAKLDARAIEFDKENLELNETLQNAMDSLEGKCNEKNVTLSFEENSNVFFKHDRLWLEEAFINIIKNSIEHTAIGGQINVEIQENPIYKRIIIEDNGEGIAEEDLGHIFKRFYKAKTSKKSDSIGIGLALSKSIIESHNGMIEAQSQLGSGTKFIITFLMIGADK